MNRARSHAEKNASLCRSHSLLACNVWPRSQEAFRTCALSPRQGMLAFHGSWLTSLLPGCHKQRRGTGTLWRVLQCLNGCQLMPCGPSAHARVLGCRQVTVHDSPGRLPPAPPEDAVQEQFCSTPPKLTNCWQKKVATAVAMACKDFPFCIQLVDDLLDAAGFCQQWRTMQLARSSLQFARVRVCKHGRLSSFFRFEHRLLPGPYSKLLQELHLVELNVRVTETVSLLSLSIMAETCEAEFGLQCVLASRSPPSLDSRS